MFVIRNVKGGKDAPKDVHRPAQYWPIDKVLMTS
jgi:hypothetical protein